MEKIKKISDINFDSSLFIKKFLDDYEYDESDNIGKKCELVLLNEKYKNPEDYLNDIEKTAFSFFKGGVILDKLKNVIHELSMTFDIKKLWIMSYPPNERLDFHIDPKQNRHIVTFNQNERFFSYEFFDSFNLNEKIGIYNNKLIEYGENIDLFNEYFLKNEPTSNIMSLEPLSIYTFGDTVHTFYNGSKKLRINLVFEIVE